MGGRHDGSRCSGGRNRGPNSGAWSLGRRGRSRCGTTGDGVAFKGEVARAVADMDGVAASAGLWDHPILADDVPDTKVLAREGESDVGGGAGCELEFLEATKLADGGIEAAIGGELEIPIPEKLELGRKECYGGYLQLSNFLSCLGSAVFNSHCDGIHYIPKGRISALTSSGHWCRFIDGRVASRVRVRSGADTARVVEIRVDELTDAAGNSCRPCYLSCSRNSGGITRNCTLRCSRGRDLGQRLYRCNLEATECKSCVAKSEPEFETRGNVVLIEVLVVDI